MSRRGKSRATQSHRQAETEEELSRRRTTRSPVGNRTPASARNPPARATSQRAERHSRSSAHETHQDRTDTSPSHITPETSAYAPLRPHASDDSPVPATAGRGQASSQKRSRQSAHILPPIFPAVLWSRLTSYITGRKLYYCHTSYPWKDILSSGTHFGRGL